MLHKNLSKERSKYRWRLAYQACGLVLVLTFYPLTVRALEHPLLGSNPALLRLERWNVPFLVNTAAATAGWLSLFLALSMAKSVWRIYSLMGVHLKKTTRFSTGKASTARPNGTRKKKTTSRS